jgi:hypothetical protein
MRRRKIKNEKRIAKCNCYGFGGHPNNYMASKFALIGVVRKERQTGALTRALRCCCLFTAGG